MKGVFDTKPNSGYDDEIMRRYHFPVRSNYMDTALAVTGDWIVYREPQRNSGRRAYIAVARLLRVDPDPARPDHAYAIIGDYLPFDLPVPFGGGDGGGYWEAPLRAIGDPNRVGAGLQGKAMRPLDDADFAAIVRAGLSETLAAGFGDAEGNELGGVALAPGGGVEEVGDLDAPARVEGVFVEAAEADQAAVVAGRLLRQHPRGGSRRARWASWAVR